MEIKFIFLSVFAFLYIFWLLLSCVFAFLGLFLKSNTKQLQQSSVLESITVCRCLYEKQLLQESEYDFETNQVARLYDQDTFRGYLFIMAPVVWVLKRTYYLDGILLFLVQKWMGVHKDKIEKSHGASTYEHAVANICVSIARVTGRALNFLSIGSK